MIRNFISQNYHTHKSFYNKSLYSFALKILSQILALAAFLLLARMLTLSDFGLYVLVMGWARIILIVDKAGIDMAANRYLSQYQSQNAWRSFWGFYRFGSRLTLGLSFLILCIGLAFITFGPLSLSTEQYLAFCVGFLIPPLWARMQYEQACLRAVHKTTQGQIPDSALRPGLMLVFIASAWAVDIDLSALHALIFMIAALFISLFVALALRLRYFWSYPVAEASAEPHETKEWLFCALFLSVITASVILLRHTDIVMLGALRGVEQAGMYGAAVKIADIATFAMGAVNMVLAPLISASFAKNDHIGLQGLLRQAAGMSFIFAFFVGGSFLIFPGMALSLFGDVYMEASQALRILLVAQIINALCGPVGFVLTMTEHQKFAGVVYAGIVGGNILANYLLIPIYGMTGAALATGISVIIWNLVFVTYCLRHLGYNPSFTSLWIRKKENSQ